MKFETEIRKFLWKNQILKNLLPLESLCLPKSRGGLNVAHLGLKCDSLLLRQNLRMIDTDRDSRKHVGYWIGDRLAGPFKFSIKYSQVRIDNSGRRVPYAPKYFKRAGDLLAEGLEQQRFDPKDLGETTTKSLYLSYLKELPPPKVVSKYPDRN